MATIRAGGNFNPGLAATESTFAGEAKATAARLQDADTQAAAATPDQLETDMAATQAADNAQGNVADASQDAELSDNKKLSTRNNTESDTAELSGSGEGGTGAAEELQQQKNQQQELLKMRKGGSPSASAGAADGKKSDEAQVGHEAHHREVAQDERLAAGRADEEQTVEKDSKLEAKAEHARAKAVRDQAGAQVEQTAMEHNEAGAIVAGRRSAGRRQATSELTVHDHAHDVEEQAEQSRVETAETARNVQSARDQALEDHVADERQMVGRRSKAKDEAADIAEHERAQEEDSARVGAVAGTHGQGGGTAAAGGPEIDEVDTVQAGASQADVQGVFDRAGVGRPRTAEQHMQFALGDTPKAVIQAATNMVEPQIQSDGTASKSQAGYKSPDAGDPTRALHLTRVGGPNDVAHSDGITGRPVLELAGRTEGQPLELEASIA